MSDKNNSKIIALNRKARHDYFVEETIEAGIELFGTEVKSVRAGTVNLKDSFVRAPWTFMKTRPIFNKNKIRTNDEF